ncbi:MAG: ArgE/DapE family deacylase [Candidatus Promineifilaceae bacterium]|nr:ArgE/DapE family deacylase [Candidatus Promineifilaceae bacterium]
MDFTVDENFTINTLKQLVQINSTNPTLAETNAGEDAIARTIASILEDIGLDVRLQEVALDRPNVIGILKGTGGGRSLMLNGHMDTVGVEGMAEPFSAAVRDGKLYGRGAQDMKGSLAAMIGSAKALRNAGTKLAGDLLLAFVVDEESLSIGTEGVVQEFITDAAIVTEPTDMTLTRAHRGFIWYDIETRGRAAHGSRFNEGIDANMHMGRFLAELDELEQELRTRSAHPLAGPPSLHASMIKGGSEISVYAAQCLLQVERRTIPGETVEACTAELQAIIDRLAVADGTFQAAVTPTFYREPFEVAGDAAIVSAINTAVEERLGVQPQHTGQTFWTDAAILAAAGIETALIGPVGAGLHSAEEWVDVQSVLDLTDILARTAVSYCS